MLTEKYIKTYLAEEAVCPLSLEELAEKLEFEEGEDISLLQNLLQKMEQEGEVVMSRKKRYGLPEQFNLYKGIVSRHPRGFGFLELEYEESEDIFLSPADLGGAMHGDRVIVRLKKQGGRDNLRGARNRAEGEVIRILQRSIERVVGTFESSRHFGFVVPDDKRFGGDIFIPKSGINGAKTGMKVIVEITRWPERGHSAEGNIVQLIGYKGAPGVDVVSVMYKYDLPQNFPAEVLESAARIPEKVQSKEYNGRRDLRDLLMITIDGDDAKDLDDAVTVEILENGNYLLGVHIADVGHYVLEDSVLDKEALKRATSIYLVDRVIPMLPQRLSNGICSLNAGEDRLALSCSMEIDKRGIVVAHEIYESVIHVDYRMTYKNVTKILVEQDLELREKYKEIVDMLENMAKLQHILEQKRIRRGAIEFIAKESKVILDKKGRAVRIEWREQGLADKIIEEFMLCANETVAEHYFWMEVPFLYRTHEEPKVEDVMDANKFLQALGYNIKGAGNTVHPKAYQHLVEMSAGKPEEKVVNTVLLRSMQHARYTTEALGHFGLAATYYSHFTSPIRRYPDLAIHRVIKELLRKGDKLDDKRINRLRRKMEEYAVQSSNREKVAEEAERESVEMKKVELMKQYEGECFNGIISGITNFGFFVELENSVEGLVHISTLIDDFYQFQQECYTLLGEHTRKTYQLGQAVRVRLTKVNVDERQIDFEVITDESCNRKS